LPEFKTFVPPKDQPPSPVEQQLPEQVSHAALKAQATPVSSPVKPFPADYPTGPVQSPSAVKPEP
jgi:hypothetical protein